MRESAEQVCAGEPIEAWSLEALAAVSAAEGNAAHSARLWGTAERVREEFGSPIPPNVRPRYDQWVATARGSLGCDETFADAWVEGRSLTLEQARALALERPLR